MGVALRGSTVRRPACVRNAHVHVVLVLQVKVHLTTPNGVLEGLHLPLGADNLNLLVVLVEGDAGRVVATVLQPLQSLDQQLQYLPAALRLEVVQIRENACFLLFSWYFCCCCVVL